MTPEEADADVLVKHVPTVVLERSELRHRIIVLLIRSRGTTTLDAVIRVLGKKPSISKDRHAVETQCERLERALDRERGLLMEQQQHWLRMTRQTVGNALKRKQRLYVCSMDNPDGELAMAEKFMDCFSRTVESSSSATGVGEARHPHIRPIEANADIDVRWSDFRASARSIPLASSMVTSERQVLDIDELAAWIRSYTRKEVVWTLWHLEEHHAGSSTLKYESAIAEVSQKLACGWVRFLSQALEERERLVLDDDLLPARREVRSEVWDLWRDSLREIPVGVDQLHRVMQSFAEFLEQIGGVDLPMGVRIEIERGERASCIARRIRS